jgi:hypothetical protein
MFFLTMEQFGKNSIYMFINKQLTHVLVSSYIDIYQFDHGKLLTKPAFVIYYNPNF